MTADQKRGCSSSSTWPARPSCRLPALPPSTAAATTFAAAIGLLWTGTVPPTNGLVATCWGPRNLGFLFGLVYVGHQLDAFVSAWAGGALHDRTGASRCAIGGRHRASATLCIRGGRRMRLWTGLLLYGGAMLGVALWWQAAAAILLDLTVKVCGRARRMGQTAARPFTPAPQWQFRAQSASSCARPRAAPREQYPRSAPIGAIVMLAWCVSQCVRRPVRSLGGVSRCACTMANRLLVLDAYLASVTLVTLRYHVQCC